MPVSSSVLFVFTTTLVASTFVSSLRDEGGWDGVSIADDETVVHATQPPRPHDFTLYFDASAHRRARRAFAAQAATPAPTLSPCVLHGRIGPGGVCICDADDNSGYWAGTYCDQCARGWSGSLCKIQCAGGSCNRCSSHGTCNEGLGGDGKCTCYANRNTGYWGGSNCSACAPNYFGSTCQESCPGLELSGLVCFGRGTCITTVVGSGVCTCISGYGAPSGCFDCDESHYGPSCARTCNGYNAVTNTACSGHGACFNGTLGNGSCVCDPYYGGFDCSLRCPLNNCEPNGVCQDGASNSATCKCFGNFAPPDCTMCISNVTGSLCNLACPPLVGPVHDRTAPICYNNGICTYTSTPTQDGSVIENAVCVCANGYFGEGCQSACTGNPPCSANGVCLGAKGCQCFDGWSGPTCNTCAATNTSTHCSIPCPTDESGNVCSNSGSCYNGVCYCDETRATFYCGDACAAAVINNLGVSCPVGMTQRKYCTTAGAYRADCQALCPGRSDSGLITVCNGHGFCDSGPTGTGLCQCTAGYGGTDCSLPCPASVLGLCSGTGRGVCTTPASSITSKTPLGVATCDCLSRYGGVDCSLDCPVVAGAVCAGKGVCNVTNTNSTCSCYSGWTGRLCNVPCLCDARYGVCNAAACANSFSFQPCSACICRSGFTGQCDRCMPGRQGEDCTGLCVHGTTSGKSCQCQTYWSGADCNTPCPTSVSGDVCSNHGECAWGNNQPGTCACEPNWYGPACNVSCIKERDCAFLLHSQCNPNTGKCECEDSFSGHWAGDQCDTCDPSYWGPTCVEDCRCNGNGVCNQQTGSCTCNSDPQNGYYTGTFCESCAPGYLGQRCERQNVDITRLTRFNEAQGYWLYDMSTAGLAPSLQLTVPPTSTVLSLDASARSLYAGGIPVYQLDVTNATLNLTSNRQASEWSPPPSPLVTIDVFTAGGHTYYLMQSTQRMAVTLYQLPTSTAAAATSNFSKFVNARNETLGSLGQVALAWKFFIADPSSPTLVIVIGAKQNGVTVPGGTLTRIDLETVFSGNPNLVAQARITKILDVTFTVSCVTASMITLAQGGNQERFAVGGSKGTTWSIIAFARATQQLVAAFAQAYLNDMVDCWPGITAGSATTSCVGCRTVTKIAMVRNAIVAVVTTKDASNFNSTAAMIFRASPDLGADARALTTTFYGKTSDGVCTAARYDRATDSLVATGSTTSLAQPGLVVDFASTGISNAVATAIAIDIDASVAVVALAIPQLPSQLVKVSLRLGNFTVYATKSLNYVAVNVTTDGNATTVNVPETLSAIAVDAEYRLLYGLISGVFYLRIATFLLYEVTSIVPDIADARGGTVVVVRGSGFTSPSTGRVTKPLCKFGGVASPASDVTFNSMACVVPGLDSVTPADSCSGQLVSVALDNATSWHTENSVNLRRVTAPRIDYVRPAFGGLKGGTVVTVVGSGLVASKYALCTFFSTNPRATEVVSTSLNFVSPNIGTCVQPKTTNSSVDPSFVNVTIDGQLYAPFGPVPYAIVGEPQSLSSPSQLSTIATFAASSVNISVEVIDDEAHRLQYLDVVVRDAYIVRNVTVDVCDPALFSWRSPDDGFPWPPCRNNTVTVQQPQIKIVNGTGTFYNIFLRQPRTGVVSIIMATADSNRWQTSTSVVIVEGTAAALALQNRAELVGKPIVDGQPMSPSPEVIVIDALGNVVRRTPADLTVQATTYHVLDNVPNRTYNDSVFLVPNPGSNTNVFRFEQIFFKFLHGATHYAIFRPISGTFPFLNATATPPLRTQLCPNPTTSFKEPGTGLCSACPPVGATCDGTENITVNPGNWRESNTSVNIYPCPGGPAVCPGIQGAAVGAPCAAGYTGPLCMVCASGYGRSGKFTCTECGDSSLNVFIVVVGATVFIAILLVWTIVTLRTGVVTDVSVIFRTVVNHMQATGKLGEFSQQWSPALQGAFQAQSTASSPSVNGLSSLDCVVRSGGTNYTGIFSAYMSLPLLAFLMSVLVFIVVRVLKLAPVLSPELADEVKKEIRSLGKNSQLAVLKQRYPLFMVTATTLCVTLFAMYQTLITEATTVLQCTTVQTSTGVKYYSTVDMSIPCYDSGGTLRSEMYLPGLVCAISYGFGIPASFMFGYKFLDGRLGKPALTRTMFLFLVGGYKPEYWWWQITIMVRKLLLVLAVTFVHDSKLQLYIGMWIMGLCLAAQIKLQPSEKSTFNIVEALSLAIITVTLNVSLIYYWPGITASGQLCVTVLLMMLTLVAVLMFAAFLVKPARDALQEVAATAKKQITQKFIGRDKGAAREEEDDFRGQKRSAVDDGAHDVESSDEELEDRGFARGKLLLGRASLNARRIDAGPRFAEFNDREVDHLVGAQSRNQRDSRRPGGALSDSAADEL